MTTTPPERPAPDATATPPPANADPTDATPTSEDTPVGREPEPPTPEDPLRGSRTSGAWIGLAVVAILLVLLIIFIAQNTQKVQVAFLGCRENARGDLQNVGYELGDWCLMRNRCNLTQTRTDSKSFSFENGLMR